MPITIPMPEQGESEERFTIRAHNLLAEQVPEPDDRNALVWQAWDQAHGPSIAAQVALKNFGNNRFAHVPSVCLFAEHETTGSDGMPRKYDLAAMVRIVRTCNERIVDFDGFSPLTDGHTPNPEDMDQSDPPIVGYAGPYRLGMMGRVKPRWGIFASEWHYRDVAAEMSRKPRRSVELWTFDHDPTHMHFDPIAILGAETPRLSLPSRYQASELAGMHVTRYSAPAFCSPGGSNTFVRQPVKGKPKMKTQYGVVGKVAGATPIGAAANTLRHPVTAAKQGFADAKKIGTAIPKIANHLDNMPVSSNHESMRQMRDKARQSGKFGADEETDSIPSTGGNSMPFANEDLGQLLAALAETPQFKFIDQLMQQQQGGGEPAGDEFAEGGDDDLGDVNDMLVDDEGGDEGYDDGGGEEGPPVAEGDEEPEKNFAPGLAAGALAAGKAALPAIGRVAMHPTTIAGAAGYLGARAGGRAAAQRNSQKASGNLAQKYSRVMAAHNKLVQEHGRLASQMQNLQRDKTDAERVAALQGLAGRYPEFVDLDGEFKATLYSRGASMNDRAFQAHVATVEKYAHKAAMTARAQSHDIPMGDLPRPSATDPQAEKYAARLTREAVRIHTAAVNAGKAGYTWDDAKAEAEKVLAARG